MPNTITFENYPELQRAVLRPVLAVDGPLQHLASASAVLCCLPEAAVPDGLGYENIFRVVIVQFLDRFNFCLGNVKRSCVHFVTPNGQIIPFDTYNMFYRNGLIDGIRAGMAGERYRADHKELVPR